MGILDSIAGKKALIPVVKVAEPMTWPPWPGVDVPALVIKAGDLINSSGESLRPICRTIERVGGIHSYLDYSGDVILSTVMKDRAIRGCSPEVYAQTIHSSRPDYFTTVDGETYEHEVDLAQAELRRIERETKNLLALCPQYEALGLIKGSTVRQMCGHADSLGGMGIRTFIFHAGDFLARGTDRERSHALTYMKAMRSRVDNFLLYGVGSRKYFRKFYRSDGFITQSHFVNAFNRKSLQGYRWKPTGREATKEIVGRNFADLRRCLEELNAMSLEGVLEWEEDSEDPGSHMPAQDRVPKPHTT